jgi:hypothetical protein
MTKNGSNVLRSKFKIRELENALPGDERLIDTGAPSGWTSPASCAKVFHISNFTVFSVGILDDVLLWARLKITSQNSRPDLGHIWSFRLSKTIPPTAGLFRGFCE